MAQRRKSPLTDIDENTIEVGRPKRAAAGVPAVAVSLKRSVESMGPIHTTGTPRSSASVWPTIDG